jgi:hypothetical protein
MLIGLVDDSKVLNEIYNYGGVKHVQQLVYVCTSDVRLSAFPLKECKYTSFRRRIGSRPDRSGREV